MTLKTDAYTTDDAAVSWTVDNTASVHSVVNLLIDAGFSVATDQRDDTEAVAMLLSSVRELCADHELSFDDALALSAAPVVVKCPAVGV